MPEIVNPETHHEKSDVNVRALLWSVVIFIVFAALTHGLLYAQFHFYRKLFSKKNNPPPLTAVARPADAAVPAEPRLQPFTSTMPPYTSTPVTDMEQMRAAEEQALHTPGWVDRQRGIVRIPIDVAKQLAVQRLGVRASRPQPPGVSPGGNGAAQNGRAGRPAGAGETPALQQGAHP
jgi:hypothetical protein